jgi:hypothetical protein
LVALASKKGLLNVCAAVVGWAGLAKAAKGIAKALKAKRAARNIGFSPKQGHGPPEILSRFLRGQGRLCQR